MSHRDEYIAKMKLQLDNLNLSIAQFETKAHAMQLDAQDAYKEGLVKLHIQSKLAIEKFDELKESSDNSWDQLVAETEKVRDAFVDSYHYFKLHF
ncbi:hypothetical protein [Solimicrobium silvestre]|uniref:Uncharacterized protein n=1 Tax=Solimicrobium silvestre TaxID=2099400 RepID=A0A2S9GSX2_9BURK|nr:hypothetical protein [Solimicrobium silvestre]PRC90819.1 hypothetical protein S2091_4482 [Solimicrobium silvestre]